MDTDRNTNNQEKRIASRNGHGLDCPKDKHHLVIGYDTDVEVDYCISF